MRIVGGQYRGKKILPSPHRGTRPTSDKTREMIFNVLLHNPTFGPGVLKDKCVLDLFAGTGALGLEALSRGAQSVFFVENNWETLPILRQNVRALRLPSACILEQDALTFQNPPVSSFDLVFLDPPYHKDLVLPALQNIFIQGWLSENAVIVVEIAKNECLDLPPFLSLVIERTSGAAKVLFCKRTIIS